MGRSARDPARGSASLVTIRTPPAAALVGAVGVPVSRGVSGAPGGRPDRTEDDSPTLDGRELEPVRARTGWPRPTWVSSVPSSRHPPPPTAGNTAGPRPQTNRFPAAAIAPPGPVAGWSGWSRAVARYCWWWWPRPSCSVWVSTRRGPMRRPSTNRSTCPPAWPPSSTMTSTSTTSTRCCPRWWRCCPCLFTHPVVPANGRWDSNDEQSYSAAFVKAQLRAGKLRSVTMASRVHPVARGDRSGLHPLRPGP